MMELNKFGKVTANSFEYRFIIEVRVSNVSNESYLKEVIPYTKVVNFGHREEGFKDSVLVMGLYFYQLVH
jgi:hypothetical protein